MSASPVSAYRRRR